MQGCIQFLHLSQVNRIIACPYIFSIQKVDYKISPIRRTVWTVNSKVSQESDIMRWETLAPGLIEKDWDGSIFSISNGKVEAQGSNQKKFKNAKNLWCSIWSPN